MGVISSPAANMNDIQDGDGSCSKNKSQARSLPTSAGASASLRCHQTGGASHFYDSPSIAFVSSSIVGMANAWQ